MRLFSPWALWFLSFLPLVVLMYILKQKFEEKQVGSIYLWQQALKDIEVNTPWQKLKKNLLLFLQLLTVLLLVFALSDPYVYNKGELYSNLIIVIDNTGSMNARYGDTTRLGKAKELAEEMIGSSGARANISILTLERSPKVEIGKNGDKREAVSRLRAIKPGNSSGNINDSVSLVRAMVKQYEGNSGYKAVFYTDSPLDTEGLNAETVFLSSGLTNASLDYISYSEDNDKLTVLVRATNRSDASLEREISLYGNDRVLDIKSIELPPGKTETVYFEGIPADVPYIWAEFTEEDDLPQDNQVYGVVNLTKPGRVLLTTAGNIFIEKALSNIKGLELYKTNPGEYTEEGFDLYIFDSTFPETLPKSGSILLINPPAGSGVVEAAAEVQGGIAAVIAHPLTKYLENAEFTVSELKSIEAPFWADVLMEINGNAAVLAGEYKERKTAVIGFDLHNSDFALTAEFPVFIYNLTAYLMGIEGEEKTSYVCGDSIELNPGPETEGITVKTPQGEIYRQELTYPMLPFERTGQYGIYEVSQKTGEAEKISAYAVNFPVESESVSYVKPVPGVKTAAEAGTAYGGTGLQEWLLGLLLLAAAIEWVVYIRGY